MRLRLSFFLTKLINYEYWPYGVFYFPLYFYGLFLALKSKSFMYFSTANPGMKYGGVMGESKYKVLSSIPKQYTPETILISSSTSYSRIKEIIKNTGFEYPFIIKPDMGERGRDVEVIRTEEELYTYLSGKCSDFNIQEFIDYDLEFGILYHRLPGASKGHITSMVKKEFLYLTGDGRHSLHELIVHEIRASGRLKYYEQKFKDKLNAILPKGQKIALEPIGNHCRGTTFRNANHLVNDQLNEVFNRIANQIDGYYYGRFDLKVPSLEDLYAGEKIKILELNGVSSEVAHVYDPDYKLIQAYKDIVRHMQFIYRIAKRNHELGHPYDSLMAFLKDLHIHFKYS